MTAVENINRYSWDSESTDQPTWMSANNLASVMADTGIDPMLQHMDGLIHLLMATPGPREGAYLGSCVTARQVTDTLKNTNVPTDLMESPTINEMVYFLNSHAAEWLHMMMLDTCMEDLGECTMQDEERVRGRHQGIYHVADSGMQSIGRRKPTTGKHNVFVVMEEYLGFVFPGMDHHVKGGAGPRHWLNALNSREIEFDSTCPAELPKLIKIPLQGSSLMTESLK